MHDRDAHADCLAIVKEFPQVRGVFHCFSGSVEIAQELIKRGWYLGFDGPLTYKNAKKTVEVAKIVPLDRCFSKRTALTWPPFPCAARATTRAMCPISRQNSQKFAA